MDHAGVLTPKNRHSDWNFNQAQAQSPMHTLEQQPLAGKQKRGRKGKSPNSNIKDIMGIYADVKQ